MRVFTYQQRRVGCSVDKACTGVEGEEVDKVAWGVRESTQDSAI